jgi:hypothetical protein
VRLRAGLDVPEAYEVIAVFVVAHPFVALINGRERAAVRRDGERDQVVVPDLPGVGSGAPRLQHEEAHAPGLAPRGLLFHGDHAVLRLRDEAPAV